MLIEIKIGSAKFIENNMGIPQEIKKNNYHVIQQSHFWVYIQRKWKQDVEKMFTSALFATTKIRKPPNVQKMKG